MYYNNRDVRLEEMAVPKIAPGELLVRIRASGICGSDLMEWYRIKKAPLVLGHEIAGEVVEVGEGVKDFQPGDRVFAAHHVPCGQCRYCVAGHQSVCDMLRTTHFDPGGFAEYVRVPKINVELGTFRLPDEITFEEGSFIEPLACVVRAQRFARLTAGQTVLVIGSGISGLLHVQLARARGAARIIATDISDFRLKAAIQFGADAIIRGTEDVPARLRDLNDGRLADLVIVCTGAMPAIQQAVKSIDRGGTLLFFAPTAAGSRCADTALRLLARRNHSRYIVCGKRPGSCRIHRVDSYSAGTGRRHDHASPVFGRSGSRISTDGERSRFHQGHYRSPAYEKFSDSMFKVSRLQTRNIKDSQPQDYLAIPNSFLALSKKL